MDVSLLSSLATHGSRGYRCHNDGFKLPEGAVSPHSLAKQSGSGVISWTVIEDHLVRIRFLDAGSLLS
jgi:hypothetical protein